DRVLHDLDQYLLALAHALADLRGAVVVKPRQVRKAPRLARTQEAGPLQSHVDESRLHAGQHALHPSEDDVADQGMAAAAVALLPWAVIQPDGALEHQVLEAAVFDDGYADFPRPRVDQDVLRHSGAQAIATRNANTDIRRPEAATSSPVGEGRPHWNKN